MSCVYVLILLPIGIAGAILSCSFGYNQALYLISFPTAGLIFVMAIIAEIEHLKKLNRLRHLKRLRKAHKKIRTLPEQRQIFHILILIITPLFSMLMGFLLHNYW